MSAAAQTVGSTKTEQYKASFETAIDISQFLDYEGPQIPIQILKAGISDEMYEMYPELKEKRVGLGVANISMEYLENLNRFKFTEDKTEIKNRMVKQFQASQAGISENKLDGRGKINLAELKPNGGSSAKDQITRVEQRLDDLYKHLLEK